jgi:hypothetical protein
MAVPACIHPEGSVELAVDRLRFALLRLELRRSTDPSRMPFALNWIKKIVAELSVALEAEQA